MLIALRLCLIAFVCAVAGSARADSWARPQVKEVFSESRDHFVRVIPGDNPEETGGLHGAGKGTTATAEFYRRQADRSYRLAQTIRLLNPVAPVDFLVSDNGQLATIDNWHNPGYGSIVAVYDAQGGIVKAYALEDLFSGAEIAAFAQSIPSRHWHRGPVYINQDQRTLYVMIESGRDLIIGLQTGQFAYCETCDGKYLCRNSNVQRRWLPYTSAVPER